MPVPSPELMKLIAAALDKADFRESLTAEANRALDEATAKYEAARVAVEAAKANLREVLAILPGEPLPRVLKTVTVPSLSRWNVNHTLQLWLEADGVCRDWSCDCESYRFSTPLANPVFPGQGKSCKHTRNRYLFPTL